MQRRLSSCRKKNDDDNGSRGGVSKSVFLGGNFVWLGMLDVL